MHKVGLQQFLSICPILLSLLSPAAIADQGYNQGIIVRPLLETDRTTLDQPIDLPPTSNAKVTALPVEIPPGAETGWHLHPLYVFAYVLSGKVTVEFESGERRIYSAHEAFVEAINVMHNGVNNGADPLRIAVFSVGEPAQPFTILPEE